MLGQPRERLGGGERLARNMCCRRGILQHRDVGVILLREAGIGTKSLDAEVGEPETLALRYIDSGIDIQQVGRTAMRLIARNTPMPMRPVRPLSGEILEKQFAERLTIVTGDAAPVISTEHGVLLTTRGGLLIVRGKLLIKYIYKRLQIISATALELLVQLRRPVRPIHFVGIIKHHRRERHLLMGKGGIEPRQIMRHSIAIEMINHQALTPRSRSLHLLTRQSHREMLPIKHHLLRRVLLRH